jgi:RNA polymerase sigma factor (sigma-70 family)
MTALSALPTCSDPVGLGANRTLLILGRNYQGCLANALAGIGHKHVVAPDSDAELWARVRGGNADALGALFERHAGAVYRFCFRRIGDWATAEDLTSIVFIETWRRCRRVELATDSALPWLLGVAANVIRNRQRSLRRYAAVLARLRPDEAETDFADSLAERLDAERAMRPLLAQIDRLPRREQDVFTLCVWEGLTSREAALALEIPEGTVRTRLSRARARLREQPPAELSPSEGAQSR